MREFRGTLGWNDVSFVVTYINDVRKNYIQFGKSLDTDFKFVTLEYVALV